MKLGGSLDNFKLNYEQPKTEVNKQPFTDRLGNRYFRIIVAGPVRSPIERVRRVFRKNNKVKETR